MKIDINTIKILAENVEKYNLNEVAVESEGVKLVIKKERPMKTVEVIKEEQIIQQPIIEEKVHIEETIQNIENEDCEYIYAPMVGTFYRASAPGNPPFVEVGQEVKDGSTVCIIEAMKLMNEVKSHRAER